MAATEGQAPATSPPARRSRRYSCRHVARCAREHRGRVGMYPIVPPSRIAALVDRAATLMSALTAVTPHAAIYELMPVVSHPAVSVVLALRAWPAARDGLPA